MAKSITLKDNDTKEPLYPNTLGSNVFDDNGNNIYTFIEKNYVSKQQLTWTYKYQKLFDTTEFDASSPQTYSIANYLPNDGGKYEILISGWAAPTRTTGKYITAEVKSDLIKDYVYLCSSRATQTNYAQDTSGSTIIFASSGSSLTFRAGSTGNGLGTMWIALHGYRRID